MNCSTMRAPSLAIDLPDAGVARRVYANVGDLAHPVPPVWPNTRCETVAQSFTDDPTLYALAVVDANGTPIGLLNRFKFLERLSRRFGRALMLSRPASQLMETSPLVLDASTPIDEVDQLFVEGDHRYVFDGFIVTREGRYAAVGTGIDLMRALTERRHSELVRQASHDSLTDLPNRHEFDERLRDALRIAGATGAAAGLLFIDLDRLKHVNDTFGHPIGDLVLCAIAHRLRASVRRTDTVARLSGDEFAIVLQEVQTDQAAAGVAAAIPKPARSRSTSKARRSSSRAASASPSIRMMGRRPSRWCRRPTRRCITRSRSAIRFNATARTWDAATAPAPSV